MRVLRARCLARKRSAPWRNDACVTMESLRASDGVASWEVRRGMLTRDLLRSFPFGIDDLELLAGRLAPGHPEWREESERACEWLAKHYPNLHPPGQTGHCELDLSRLFARGIDGLRADLGGMRDAATGRKAEAYESFSLALEGLSAMAGNAARAAEAARETAGLARRAELEAIAASCRRMSRHPPRSFLDALQLLWLVILGCHYGDGVWLVSPGHLDRSLLPFYRADLDGGRLTRDGALQLLESLYLLINEFLPDGLAIAGMVGGRDPDGHDATNDLSYLCLEALRRTRLVYPTVGLCWHRGTPAALTDLALDLITHGYSTPAFFGDETIQRGLRLYGVPERESCHYINSTCVEITPSGGSNVWVASPYFPTCTILLDEIDVQADRAPPAPDFDAFLAAYRARLARHIAEAVADLNRCRELRQMHGGKPLQSVFTRDCIDRGRDIDDGGARYNWVECSFVGLANLADSLYVIRDEVYQSGRLTLGQLRDMLKADFQGHETERHRLLRVHPKYGNDSAGVDRLVGDMVAFVRAECAKHRMLPDDSPFVPGAFCWIMHEQLGRKCGATPDGRRAGFPFADGCGGAQGREECGPTAAILSVTSWDAAPLIGGAAFNMKFSAALFSSPRAVARLRDLIVTFLNRGGFETQVNVVDRGMLERARARPEEYRDLVVRIGGYTDYFTRLSPEMQAEVILRTEFEHL